MYYQGGRANFWSTCGVTLRCTLSTDAGTYMIQYVWCRLFLFFQAQQSISNSNHSNITFHAGFQSLPVVYYGLLALRLVAKSFWTWSLTFTLHPVEKCDVVGLALRTQMKDDCHDCSIQIISLYTVFSKQVLVACLTLRQEIYKLTPAVWVKVDLNKGMSKSCWVKKAITVWYLWFQLDVWGNPKFHLQACLQARQRPTFSLARTHTQTDICWFCCFVFPLKSGEWLAFTKIIS